jgi:hypothetical protein
MFSSFDDMSRVLHHPPTDSSVTLMFKHWRRQLPATADKFLYRVIVRFRLYPCTCLEPHHAQQLFGPSYSCLQVTPSIATKIDLCRFTMTAWCRHPDLVPTDVVMAVLKQHPVHVPPPPLLEPRRNNLTQSAYSHLSSSYRCCTS